MSRFIACLTDADELALSEKYYTFIQDKGELPSEDAIHFCFKNSENFEDACHQINKLFVEVHLWDALLNAVSASNRSFFSKQFAVERYIDESLPEFDVVTIRFQNIVLHNPEIEAVEELYNYLAKLDACLRFGGAAFKSTYSITVSEEILNKLKNTVEEGVLEPVIDSSCGNSKTMIIELDFIRDLAITNDNSKQILNSIWQILCDDKPELTKLREINPDLLVLTASIG